MSSVHSLVSNFGLFFVLEGSQFHYVQAYPSYCWSLEVDWDGEACVGLFSYTPLSGGVLDITAREESFAKKNVDDVQVKHFVSYVPVKLKPGL